MRWLVLTFALLASATTSPAAAQSAPGSDAASASALVRRYLGDVHDRRYDDAFLMLESTQRAYFRNGENFASGFQADGAALDAFTIAGVRGSDSAWVVFARERITLDDPAHDLRVTTVVTEPYLVAGRGPRARIGESGGRPWRAFAANATSTSGNVRVTVKKVAMYADHVRVVLTMQNDGTGFVTVLPYGRSVLRDAAGAIYQPIATHDWTITDRQLYLGVRLAPNSRYTGALAFATPLLDAGARRFTLTVGPIVRDGAAAPFSVDVAGVAARG